MVFTAQFNGKGRDAPGYAVIVADDEQHAYDLLAHELYQRNLWLMNRYRRDVDIVALDSAQAVTVLDEGEGVGWP